jgi:hypothetical protein
VRDASNAIYVVYMENFSRPEEGDDNCRKMTHIG